MCCCGGASFSLCCSENVGQAACNPTLDSNCLTGANCFYSGATTVVCVPQSGSDTSLCAPPSCIPTLPSTVCTPNPDSQYTSPLACGASDTPPAPCKCCSVSGTAKPSGGGSGGGSAGSSKGGAAPPIPHSTQCNALTKMLANLLRLGSSTAALTTGPALVPASGAIPGQSVPYVSKCGVISPNTFLLVIVVIGILLLAMAFGRGE